jgi:outer membrane immunogenic protein
MSRFLLPAAVLPAMALAGMTFSALAADLPSRKDAPVLYSPAPAFSWTGFYAGVEGGVNFFNTSGLGFSSGQTGGLIGGLVGYNYQINNFVLGLEANGGAVLAGNRTVADSSGFNPFGNVSTSNSYYADLRGRVGYAVMDRTLLYAAGGVAFGDVTTNYLNNVTGGLPISVASNRTGYTVGAGVDYAFTNNWIGRVEYRYTDLGRSTYANVYDRVHSSSNAVLVGLIYKFAPPESIVAKY